MTLYKLNLSNLQSDINGPNMLLAMLSIGFNNLSNCGLQSYRIFMAYNNENIAIYSLPEFTVLRSPTEIYNLGRLLVFSFYNSVYTVPMAQCGKFRRILSCSSID